MGENSARVVGRSWCSKVDEDCNLEEFLLLFRFLFQGSDSVAAGKFMIDNSGAPCGVATRS